jgi:Flp pilus assembly protein TadB
MARATRSQIPARDVLIQGLDSLPASVGRNSAVEQLRHGDDIAQVLTNLGEATLDEERYFQFIHQSLVNGVLVPQSLEQAASILRDENRLRQEMKTATAQANFSAQLLTLLPIAVLLLLLLFSPTARNSILLGPSLVVLLFGMSLNRIGWRWMKRLIRKLESQPTDLSQHFAEALCISLRAGVPLHHAIENWSLKYDSALYQSLSSGNSLSDALQDFSRRIGGNAEALTHLLLTAERDGLPVAQTIHHLSNELRQQRRHEADVKMRILPSKLSMPVVLFVLPSFVFLTIAPLIIANLSHFNISPPPITTPQ